MRSFVVLGLWLAAALGLAQEPLHLTILHTNDLHAHPEPFTMAGASYGGYARQATLIKRLRAAEPNSILLNAGDTFQGTMYFTAYDGLADLACMNAMGYQAACLGNHEFDGGPALLSPFLKEANFPVLACNLDVSGEPRLAPYLKPSAVLTVAGQRIGIVGAVTPDAANISSPGPTVKFLDLRTSVQGAVDDLKRQGINKIILLTHIGYAEDQALAKSITDVDVIVGGHSHSPLGTPALAGWPTPAGPYPTYVNDANGKRVVIVQAYEWGKVVGHLEVDFDAQGEVTAVKDAAVTVVDSTIPEDPLIASMVEAFKRPIAAIMNAVVGSTPAELTHDRNANVMANVIADAMQEGLTDLKPDVSFVNLGGVRGGLPAGPITYGGLVAVQPFRNTMSTLSMTGAELVQVLEEGATAPEKLGGLLYPSSSLTYQVDFSKPAGSHVSNVTIDGRPLQMDKTYLIAVNGFTMSGGDSHFVLRDLKGTRTDTKRVDIDLLAAYVRAHNPLTVPSATRILFVQP